MQLVLYIGTSLLIGGVLGWWINQYFILVERKRAQTEAKEIVDRAKDQAELLEMDQKEKQLEIEEDLWGKAEPELFKMEEKIADLESHIETRNQQIKSYAQSLRDRLSPQTQVVDQRAKVFKASEQKYEDLKKELHQLHQSWVDSLNARLERKKDELKQSLISDFIEEANSRRHKFIAQSDEELAMALEGRAKKILATTIDRFSRPYCSERGLGAVEIPTPEAEANLFDTEKKNIALIEELCGCDVIVENETKMVSVAGYDPVRRELTRRLLEKLLREKKRVTEETIRRRHDDIKRELFRQIKNDGDQIAKELGLQNLHPEVRQMMGSLRYRYSFTQNQYFHCAEVGWLCGLLAGELNLEVKKARRAGMLHDIGKSMDHALDGGHAMIGADFIQSRNESPDVVHAVRSHHFDEQPATELAYLVIAADAISGARPGARRSTIESYNQKVTELETIALSFEGVIDCFILSGGREVRVVVDGRKIDDGRSLNLSAEIARKVEAEVNYPGQIKIVVVRSVISQEVTHMH